MEFLQFIEQKKTLGFHQFFVFCPLHFNSLKISTFQTFRLLLLFFKIIIFINNLIIVECFFIYGRVCFIMFEFLFTAFMFMFIVILFTSINLHPHNFFSYYSFPMGSLEITFSGGKSCTLAHFHSPFFVGGRRLVYVAAHHWTLALRTVYSSYSVAFLAFSYLPNTFLLASSSAIGLVGFTS